MNIPRLQIGDLIAKLPIIQGAMGIGVSGPKLAAAVANEGGVGMISGVNPGYDEHDFKRDPFNANIRALKNQIRKARELAPNGIIGVNLMVAMNHYEEIAKTVLNEGIDLIVSGAGLPLKLPGLVEGFKTRIAPIVSSAKAAKVLLKFWDKHYSRTADMVIVEGPKAGGHLGFTKEQLSGANDTLLNIVKEVKGIIKEYQERFNVKIPVIAAGGIYSAEDIAESLQAGADGVQMATRFVATDECDADIRYKEAYIASKEEDIVIIQSPVGMPGRALNNEFIKGLKNGAKKIIKCSHCLQGCNPKVAPYCISDALINAVKGDIENGLIFVGTNSYKLDKIVPVKQLISELVSELKRMPTTSTYQYTAQ